MPQERQAPDALLAQINLSGAVGAIQDDPDSADANWLTAPGANNNTEARVSFASPTGNPTVGADLQEFRALVRKTNHSTNPTARIELWENGALVRAGTSTAISSTSGVVLSFTWNASELGTADGSLVECKVVGTVGGGSPGNRASVEVGAIEWNAQYDAAAPPVLEGALAFTLQCAAALDVDSPLAASMNLAIELSANLDATAPLAGVVQSSLTASATLDAETSLSTTLVGDLTLAGDLSVPGPPELSGLASFAIQFTGAVEADAPLSGSYDGSLFLSALLEAEIALAAAWEGTLTAAGELAAETPLVAAFAGNFLLLGSLTTEEGTQLTEPSEATHWHGRWSAPTKNQGSNHPYFKRRKL